MRLEARLAFICCIVLSTGSAVACSAIPPAGCSADEGPADAQRLWLSHHPTDYQFTWQQQCFCLPDAVQPIRVTVRGGAITTTTDLQGNPVSADIRAGLMTIDRLYERLRNTHAGAEVRFDCAGAGIPAHVFIDPNTAVSDDEFDVTISDFTALQ